MTGHASIVDPGESTAPSLTHLLQERCAPPPEWLLLTQAAGVGQTGQPKPAWGERAARAAAAPAAGCGPQTYTGGGREGSGSSALHHTSITATPRERPPPTPIAASSSCLSPTLPPPPGRNQVRVFPPVSTWSGHLDLVYTGST